MNGLMELDPQRDTISPLLGHRNSESFRGCNDLHIATSADIYFTDQGQTGLHDPTGRVFRLCSDGRPDCLISNESSPNGLVLSPDEAVLLVAMTRDNSIWRVPLMRDGGVVEVGRFSLFFGTSDPDGLTMIKKGGSLSRTPPSATSSSWRRTAKRSPASSPALGRPARTSYWSGKRHIAHYGILYRISVDG